MPTVLAVAAVAGAGTMVVELSAVRLLAPWFGSSLAVWTNVIAVVLLALALGYLVGGRLAAGPRPLRCLGLCLLATGALTAWVPAVARPVVETFLPAGVALQETAGLVGWGSLAASLLLFLLPAAALGAVPPLAVEAVQRQQRGPAGRAGGGVLCASTLGSLAGVFGTTHLLLPGLGLTATFILAGGCLTLAGAAALAATWNVGRSPTALLLAPAALAVGWALVGSRFSPPALAEGLVLLDAGESPYQWVRVVEDIRGPEPVRLLQVNEGSDSFQSVWQPEPGLLPEGHYYNDFVLPLWWQREQQRWRVLVLGLGGGTAWRVIEGAAPPGVELELAGVELDPLVLELARRHMQLPDTAGMATGTDARVALRCLGQPQELIVLDCYANQVEIPAHLATVEWFAELHDALAPGGWLAVNVGGFGFDDPVVSSVAASCAVGFGSDVLCLRVPLARNHVVFARRDGALPVEDGRLVGIPGPVGERLVAPLELPGSWRVVSPHTAAGLVLTDDRSPTDRLQARSTAEARARLRGE